MFTPPATSIPATPGTTVLPHAPAPLDHESRNVAPSIADPSVESKTHPAPVEQSD